ncbi:MAG TPA: DinB family protein [Dehalococcoidia bacterium]|nr:DinB family protein [Dehalococcoidia bacterium]
MDFKKLLIRQYRWNTAIVRHMIGQLTDDLTEDELNWQARPGHHSIWHHIWHMFLSNDYYSANALEMEPVWEKSSWKDRLDLTPMARAFEYEGNAEDGPVPRWVIADVPDELVDELKAIPLPSYLAYVDELFTTTLERLTEAPDEALLRRIPWYFDMTRPAYESVVGMGHVYRHIGMMEDLRGLIRGPGAGTASI